MKSPEMKSQKWNPQKWNPQKWNASFPTERSVDGNEISLRCKTTTYCVFASACANFYKSRAYVYSHHSGLTNIRWTALKMNDKRTQNENSESKRDNTAGKEVCLRTSRWRWVNAGRRPITAFVVENRGACRRKWEMISWTRQEKNMIGWCLKKGIMTIREYNADQVLQRKVTGKYT